MAEITFTLGSNALKNDYCNTSNGSLKRIEKSYQRSALRQPADTYEMLHTAKGFSLSRDHKDKVRLTIAGILSSVGFLSFIALISFL